MLCPNCGSNMGLSYNAKTGKDQRFECKNCGFEEEAFDAYARDEGYPADPDEFEDWRKEKGLD